jgi:putative membrane protein
MMDYGFGYGGWGGFGFLGMILWMAIIFIGIIALVRLFGHGDGHKSNDHDQSGIDILRERYAKGEIDKKEFEEKKKDLES